METWDSNGASSVRGFLNVWFSPLDRSLRRVFRQPARRWREQQEVKVGPRNRQTPVPCPSCAECGGRRTSGRSHPPGDLDACCGLGHVLAAQRKAGFNSTSAGGLIWT